MSPHLALAHQGEELPKEAALGPTLGFWRPGWARGFYLTSFCEVGVHLPAAVCSGGEAEAGQGVHVLPSLPLPCKGRNWLGLYLTTLVMPTPLTQASREGGSLPC